MIPSIEYLRGRAVPHRRRAWASFPRARWRRWRCSRRRRSSEMRTIAVDTSSRTSTALLARAVPRAVRHRRRSSCRCRPTCERDAASDAMPRCSSAIRRCYLDHRAAGRAEDRPRRAVDRADRAAVRLGVLGRTSGRPVPRPRYAALTRARDAGVAASDAIAAAYCGPESGGARPGLLEGQYPVHARRARGAAGLRRTTSWRRRHERDRGRRASRCAVLPMTDATMTTRGKGAGRRPARSSRGARAVSARADAAPRAARRRHSRAQASRRHRHLHHRPQRQLHERLRRALQLLRVLSAGRLGRRLRARLRGDLQEDRRDDRARRRAAAAAGRAQSRSAARVVRGSVPRREGSAIPRSGCTRCRRRK